MTVLFFCLGWVSCLWAATLYVFTLSPLAVKSAGTDMIVIVAALAILGLTAVLWSEIANRFRGR